MIDLEPFAQRMDGLGLAGKGDPVEHRFVSGGTQNQIYEIRRGDLHCAMRTAVATGNPVTWPGWAQLIRPGGWGLRPSATAAPPDALP